MVIILVDMDTRRSGTCPHVHTPFIYRTVCVYYTLLLLTDTKNGREGVKLIFQAQQTWRIDIYFFYGNKNPIVKCCWLYWDVLCQLIRATWRCATGFNGKLNLFSGVYVGRRYDASLPTMLGIIRYWWKLVVTVGYGGGFFVDSWPRGSWGSVRLDFWRKWYFLASWGIKKIVSVKFCHSVPFRVLKLSGILFLKIF